MTAARPVELSLFPEVAPDRPRGPIPGSVQTGTNADLIATIAPLYLGGHSVLDVTYGKGAWWRRYTPDRFTCHDINLDGVDFRQLPEPDSSVDVVCFDPPYVPCGSLPQPIETSHQSSAGAFREAYGLQPMSHNDIETLFRDGLAECARVASRWVLAKCSDYVTSGRFTLGHLAMIDAARSTDLADPWDLIVHHTGPGPGGHNITTPIRARRHHSYLLVFAPDPRKAA